MTWNISLVAPWVFSGMSLPLASSVPTDWLCPSVCEWILFVVFAFEVLWASLFVTECKQNGVALQGREISLGEWGKLFCREGIYFFFRVILVFIDSNSNIYEDILICSRSVIPILDNPERSPRSLFRYMIKHHYCGWRKTRWKEVTWGFCDSGKH